MTLIWPVGWDVFDTFVLGAVRVWDTQCRVVDVGKVNVVCTEWLGCRI